jgi:hypothetical protein
MWRPVLTRLDSCAHQYIAPAPSAILTHPIANVLQSVAGAIAVMGSKIVRVEMCSEVEGSKSVIEP